MNTLLREMSADSTTNNGALTLSTSGKDLVDLFFLIGASRGKDITRIFRRAFSEDKEVASRILLYARDIRGGMGERETFRKLMSELLSLDELRALRLMKLIPEIGRWDDVIALSTKSENASTLAFWMIQKALLEKDGLCAKWLPRDENKSKPLRKALKLSAKQYRKLIVSLSDTVEQKMSAHKWKEIDYSKLPSQAASRYMRTFKEHDPDGYEAYISSLEKGDAKINAGAILPHEIYRSANNGNEKVANAQWEALPDFMGESNENILPVVDVSGSMMCPLNGDYKTGCITCMDVSVALGMYLSERIGGSFKDHFITFSRKPQLQSLRGDTPMQRLHNLRRASWGYNTDLQAVFNLLLTSAKRGRVPESEMPTKILILSDMEFDAACCRNGVTNFQAIDLQYKGAGYKRPDIVFWNLNARGGNLPVRFDEVGTALVSGFSPYVMKSVLSGENFTPLGIVLNTVMVDRYKH